jgi:hypothetical protein|tara:strand:+ start:1709 stop:2113 length:405 start_codon:yes stop_codon:yes gene_type:complete
MNANDKKALRDLSISMSDDMIKKYKHKNTDPDEWIRFYYYKNKKKTLVEDLDYDFEVSSTLNYKTNTMYLMSIMSQKDPYFDYYFTLKSDLPKCIIKKSNRNKSDNVRNKTKINNYKTDYERCPKTGKIIVRFD